MEYNPGMVTTTTHLTYDDLRQIPPDRNRYELIEGELFVSAAPNTEHQRKTSGFRGSWQTTSNSATWAKCL